MHDQVVQNQRRSFVLIATSVVVAGAVIAAVAYLLGGGLIGVAVAVVIASLMGFASYRWSDAIVLRLSRAEPADADTFARLHNVVDGLCIASGVPQPDLYVIDEAAPNAFATGRSDKHASIVVTTGLLEMMDRVELEAVLAHELSHVKNRDILVGTVAVTTVGLPTLVADVFVRLKWRSGGRAGPDEAEAGKAPYLGFIGTGLLGLSPLLARQMQLATDPGSEARADVAAVAMTRYPPGLISALDKLDQASTVVASGARSTAHLWIAAPLARSESEGQLWKQNGAFDLHPPLEERIEVLREL